MDKVLEFSGITRDEYDRLSRKSQKRLRDGLASGSLTYA